MNDLPTTGRYSTFLALDVSSGICPGKCQQSRVKNHNLKRIRKPRDLAPFRISLHADHRIALKIIPYQIGITLNRKTPGQIKPKKSKHGVNEPAEESSSGIESQAS